MKTKARKGRQGLLGFPEWGGAREGSGRKPRGRRAQVPHTPRPRLPHYVPVHVTLRLVHDLPSLRDPCTHKVLLEALIAGSDRFGFRLIHYSAQGNHLHLICEAEDRTALSRGLQGLKVRITRALNTHWKRTGTVFEGRYHCHQLRTLAETYNALKYLLLNAHHHRISFPERFDPYSSGRWFFEAAAGSDESAGSPFPVPRTWHLLEGWRKKGDIDVPCEPTLVGPTKPKLRAARDRGGVGDEMSALSSLGRTSPRSSRPASAARASPLGA